MAVSVDEAVSTGPVRDHSPPARRFGGRGRAVVEVALLAVLAVVMLFPALWMIETSIKENRDVYAIPAKFFDFQVTLDHFRDVFVASGGGRSALSVSFLNSVVVAGASTVLATVLGVPAAWAYSRFAVKAKKDQLFFILSTRMLPPIVVAIPMFLMYRAVGLNDTHLGLILLYTAFNLSFAVWLMKGFIDEIPKEYEEAALVDGYTRMQAFFKIVIPEAATGIAATAVFCFITAWNEYAFALILTNRRAQTAPPFIPSQVGTGLQDWTVIAAGTVLFLLPVAIFTFLLRNHLLRGMSFGAIRK